MPTINPYLNFNGNAGDAFTHYKSLFGGEFLQVMRFKDVPSEYQLSATEGEKIMHIALPIGSNTILMGSDVPDAYGKAIIGNNVYISITADSKEQADHLFTGLSEDGNVAMPMENTFWGDYFGMLTDKFGIQWMISFNTKQAS